MFDAAIKYWIIFNVLLGTILFWNVQYVYKLAMQK